MLTYHVLTWNWVLSDVTTEAYISQCECQGLSISPVIVFTQTQRAKVGSKSAAGPGIQNAGEIKVDTRAGGEPVRRKLGTITNHLVVTTPDFDQLGFRAWCVTCFGDLT